MEWTGVGLAVKLSHKDKHTWNHLCRPSKTLYAAPRECRAPNITRLSRSDAKVVFLSFELWARTVPGIRQALERGTEKSNNQEKTIL
jgi:hypothetical protein